MTPTLEKILEEVKALSPNEKTQLREILAQDQPRPPARDIAFIDELCGRYRDVLIPTGEFIARKQEEIDLE